MPSISLQDNWASFQVYIQDMVKKVKMETTMVQLFLMELFHMSNACKKQNRESTICTIGGHFDFSDNVPWTPLFPSNMFSNWTPIYYGSCSVTFTSEEYIAVSYRKMIAAGHKLSIEKLPHNIGY